MTAPLEGDVVATTPEEARAALARAEATVARARSALVTAALAAHRGNRSAAAVEVGVTPRHLQRLLVGLGLVEELDATAAREGWHEGPGPAAASLRGKARQRAR